MELEKKILSFIDYCLITCNPLVKIRLLLSICMTFQDRTHDNFEISIIKRLLSEDFYDNFLGHKIFIGQSYRAIKISTFVTGNEARNSQRKKRIR